MVHIQLRKGDTYRQEELRSIGKTLQEHEGYTPVSFTIENNSCEELRAGAMYHVDYSRTLLNELEALPLVKKAWIS